MIKRFLIGSTLAALLLTSMLLTMGAGEAQREIIRDLLAHKLTVITSATIADDLIVADTATVGTDLTVGDDLKLTPQSANTVTGAGITPTGSFQVLTAAGAVGSGITAGAAGDVLLLVNSANQTITITDTGIIKASGNIALGQYDTAILVSDGTNWYLVGESDN